ncbi:hypothetical protein DFQ26_009292 [Actinomortierella ambigua]|nr:hypothetical protein DFQ26_009292 [Actinomortierella ambigua]
MTTTNSSTTMVSSMSVSTTGDSDSQAKQQKLGSSSSPSLDAVSSNPPQASENEKLLSLEEGQDLIEDEESNETITVVVEKRSGPHAHSRHDRRYAKTLRLTSDQLKSLNLKRGANTLTFSVASSYQGKATCVAKLFLWQYDYQVVISDIDGTITKSDALGHLFTMAGKDWTHLGVAKLYTDIVNNGYHVLYLTSRAIGQADYTRKYLKGVEQDNYQLPDGPVIMSPDRLFTAFHREVIMRKPEEFKMACLRDIKRLFGERNPFYAGFGNRYTDMLSYRSVSVPVSRIFTIDPGGEVKLELLSTYKSTYIALNDLVHQMFPCQKVVSEYNDWNYWKQPLPTIELPLAPTSTPQPLQTKIPIDSVHNSGGHSQHHPMGTIPVSPSSSGGRLGVIRTLTNSLTSAGSLKKRPSIPAFASSPAALGHGANAFLATSSMTTMTTMTTTTMTTTTMSAAAASSTTIQMGSSGDRASGGDSVQSSNGGASGGFVPASPPPSSAPNRLDIATKGRRLSLSLMRYGSSNSQNSASSTATTATTASSSSSQATLVESGTSIAATYSSSSVTSSTSLLAGATAMSATTSSSSSSSAAVTSGIIGQGLIGGSSLPPSSSSPGDSTIDISTSDNDHRGDGSRIVVERRAASASPPPPAAPPVTRSRGFSVSPPPLASRLSETLLPYLRGSSSLSSSLNHSASVAAENSTPPPTATATTITTTSATTMVAGRGRSHSSAGSGGGNNNNNNNNSNNNSGSNGGSAGDGTGFSLDEQDQLALDNMEPIVGSWPTSDRLANLHRHGGGSSGGGGSGGGGGGGGGFSWTGRGMEEQSVLLSPFTELGSERRYGGVEEDEDEDVDEDLDLEDEDDEIDYEDDEELELEEEEELFPDEEPHLEAPFL